MKEWLYPLPDFIRSRPPYKSVKEELIQGETSGLDGRLDMDRIADFGGLRHKLRRILDRGLTVWKGEKWGRGTEAFSFGAHNAFVVDVGRSTRNEIYTRFEWCDAEDLDEYLRKPRSVEKAKKRFQSVLTNKKNNDQADL